MSESFKSYILDFLECMNTPDDEPPRCDNARTFNEIIAQIDENEMDRSILKLFELAGRDHRSADHWYAVIGLFADVLFDKKKLGRHPKWKRPKDATLQQDFQRCVRRYHKRNGRRICETLKEELPKRYSAPASTILRWVSDAGISIKEIRRKAEKQSAATKVRRN
jgi:hypothetical protein